MRIWRTSKQLAILVAMLLLLAGTLSPVGTTAWSTRVEVSGSITTAAVFPDSAVDDIIESEAEDEVNTFEPPGELVEGDSSEEAEEPVVEDVDSSDQEENDLHDEPAGQDEPETSEIDSPFFPGDESNAGSVDDAGEGDDEPQDPAQDEETGNAADPPANDSEDQVETEPSQEASDDDEQAAPADDPVEIADAGDDVSEDKEATGEDEEVLVACPVEAGLEFNLLTVDLAEEDLLLLIRMQLPDDMEVASVFSLTLWLKLGDELYSERFIEVRAAPDVSPGVYRIDLDDLAYLLEGELGSVVIEARGEVDDCGFVAYGKLTVEANWPEDPVEEIHKDPTEDVGDSPEDPDARDEDFVDHPEELDTGSDAPETEADDLESDNSDEDLDEPDLNTDDD